MLASMLERAVRQAMRRFGDPAETLGVCPVCGRSVTTQEERVRAWQGKYAHSRCASYHRRRHSHRVHSPFTAT
jgi:hypothetical protein